jgi:cobalt-zinc-cadmium efflux system outer membrane protein
MRSFACLVLGLTFFTATGCASTSAESDFADTTKLVQQRTGRSLHWDNGTDDDQKVARTLRTMLAHDLSVDDAVAVALLENKSLQATYEDLSIAQADLVQAGLLKNPVIGGGLEFPVAGNVTTGGNLSISEDFLGIFSIAAKKKIAGAALRAAELRVGASVIRMVCDVQSAFYALQAAEQVTAMRKATLEAGDASLDLARRQHDAGNISDLDLASHESMVEELRTDVLRSESNVVTSREILTRLMGVGGADANYRVFGKLPELPTVDPKIDNLEALAVTRRLDLAAAAAEEEQMARALSLTKTARFLGGASVGASYERAPERYSTLGPNASLELPIFDQKQAAVAKLEAELRVAIARKNELDVNIRSEVREASSRLAATRAVVERYAKVVLPLRDRVVALSQEQYDAMLIGTYQLLQSKQNQVNAYRELIEALRDYWLARANLERATGGALAPQASASADINQNPKGAQ